MNSLVLVSFFFVLLALLQVAVLHFSCRTFRLHKRSRGRASFIVFARLLILLGCFFLVAWLAESIRLLLVAFVLDAVVTILLVQRLFRGRFMVTLCTWGINLVLGGVLTTGLVFGLREFCAAYQMVSSAMSPNLRGYHTIEELSDGNHLIHAANDPRDEHGIPPGGKSGAIVAETYECRESSRPATHTHTADRVLCNKTKFPVCWDATAFRNPIERKKPPSNDLLACLVSGSRFGMDQCGLTAND